MKLPFSVPLSLPENPTGNVTTINFWLRWLLLPALLLFMAPASAHEVRPAYLHLEETSAGEFDVTWRVPARGDLRLSLDVEFDSDATATSPPRVQVTGGYYDERWRIRHPQALAGSSITIAGLENTLTDALVRIRWQDGREQLHRLMPESPTLQVEEKAGSLGIARTYFVLGVEHILLGIDHLLFVLALILLVSGWPALLGTITAFTLAHSITLVAAVLGWLVVPSGPVEAIIALSIVFVASEVIHKHRGRRTLAVRKPWLVAFGFGLLHGLGFAGALADIGVPQHAIPLSLALFNIGVEAGQLLFIAAAFGLFVLLRRLPPVTAWQLRTDQAAATAVAWPVAYLVGALAFWWLLERTLALLW